MTVCNSPFIHFPCCLSEKCCVIIRALARNSTGSNQLRHGAVGMQWKIRKVPHIIRLLFPRGKCSGIFFIVSISLVLSGSKLVIVFFDPLCNDVRTARPFRVSLSAFSPDPSPFVQGKISTLRGHFRCFFELDASLFLKRDEIALALFLITS